MAASEPAFPDLQPGDERIALLQRLDQYRAVAAASLADVPWHQASARLLPATDMTIAGIVKHLAWAEDRWFQGRLLGRVMPAPWDAPGADDPDHSIRLRPGDTRHGILALYAAACDRSRDAVARCDSLDHVAAVPSFGRGPVNLRWILVHMIEETARHAGHLDLLRDARSTLRDMDLVRVELADDPTVDITTTGRQTGLPRRIEIWMLDVDGRFYITGTPGPRDWFANLTAHPSLVVHLKRHGHVDLPARAAPVEDSAARRSVLEHLNANWYRTQEDLDVLVESAPMVEITFDDHDG